MNVYKVTRTGPESNTNTKYVGANSITGALSVYARHVGVNGKDSLDIQRLGPPHT